MAHEPDDQVAKAARRELFLLELDSALIDAEQQVKEAFANLMEARYYADKLGDE